MSGSWQEVAAQKGSAEDRLIDRYRLELFDGERPADSRGYPTIETPWGCGRQIFPGLYVAGIGRRSVWPETQMVLQLFLTSHPDKQVIGWWGIWPPGHRNDSDPPYNEMFSVNLAESVHKHASRWLALQPGPVAYFIWWTPTDLEHPPALGDPPPELLSARAELDAIRSRWTE